VADPKILKGEGSGRQFISPVTPSSFTANAHNELYAFYTEKGGFVKKFSANRRGGRTHHPSPFE